MTLEEEFNEMKEFIKSVNPENRPWSVVIDFNNFGGEENKWYGIYVEKMSMAADCYGIEEAKDKFIRNIVKVPKGNDLVPPDDGTA
jgi:hypothetical protein